MTETKDGKILSVVIEESMRMKNKAKEIENWLLKLDLDPKKDTAYITMVGYIEALEFVISQYKNLNEGSNDKINRTNFFNKN